MTIVSVLASVVALRNSQEDLADYIARNFETNASQEVRLALSCSMYPISFFVSTSQLLMLQFNRNRNDAKAEFAEVDSAEYLEGELGLPLSIRAVVFMHVLMAGVWLLYECLISDGALSVVRILRNRYFQIHCFALGVALYNFLLLGNFRIQRLLDPFAGFTFGDAILHIDIR